MGVKVKYFVAPIIVGALLGGLAYTGWKSMNPTVEEEGLAGLFGKKETIYV